MAWEASKAITFVMSIENENDQDLELEETTDLKPADQEPAVEETREQDPMDVDYATSLEHQALKRQEDEKQSPKRELTEPEESGPKRLRSANDAVLTAGFLDVLEDLDEEF